MEFPYSPQALAAMMDYSVLNPETQEQTIIDTCGICRAHRFGAYYSMPCWTPVVARELAGTGIEVGVGLGFPFGTNRTAIKLAEAELCLQDGANALDMVINIGALKDRKYELIRAEVTGLVRLAGSAAITKIIFETWALTAEEIIACTEICNEAGVNYIKTSTGRGKRGPTIEEVRLMKAHAAPGVQVKAAGLGAYNYTALALACIDAGASRIGTRNAPEIIDEYTRLQAMAAIR
jgi:deoxyribose-phosphate aldolase